MSNSNIVTTSVLRLKHGVSLALHAYADYRIGATKAEKHCYKQSDSILLTFDDYGTEDEVKDILRILKQKKVKAMFFLQGDWARQQPQLVQAIADAGHIIGNHTETHRTLRGQDVETITSEITRGPRSAWFRPPQGRYDRNVRIIAHKLGYAICYWTIDSRDWTGASAMRMRHTILSELHPGAVVLFHLHGAYTRDLLPELIDDIRERGFTLTPFSETWKPPKILTP